MYAIRMLHNSASQALSCRGVVTTLIASADLACIEMYFPAESINSSPAWIPAPEHVVQHEPRLAISALPANNYNYANTIILIEYNQLYSPWVQKHAESHATKMALLKHHGVTCHVQISPLSPGVVLSI